MSQADEALPPPHAARARTLSVAVNPYDLPLDAGQLEALRSTLGSFTLHRLLGLLCAVASVPEPPPPSFWLGEIMQHVRVADEAHARRVVAPLMLLHDHVVALLADGEIEGLVPEPADFEACRAWAQGYTIVLGRLDPASIDEEALESGFAIQALAEVPEILVMLDEIRGSMSREAMRADFCESLADDAGFLLDTWAESSAPPRFAAAVETVRREAPKVGRNDPCPCGSGKKYKKCCAQG